MKIDLLVYSLAGGGAERVAVNLANGLFERGHTVRILCQTASEKVEYLPIVGVRILNVSGTSLIRRLLALRKQLRLDPPDRLIAVQANAAIEAAISGYRLGLPTIGCEHNTPSRSVRGHFWKFLRPFAYKRLDSVVTLTQGAAKGLAAVCDLRTPTVIPNAVRLPLPRTEPVVSVAGHFPLRAKVLLAAGRFVEAKGFDRLISAFKELATLLDSAYLVLLGDGPLRGALEQQVAALGLTERVLMPGRAGNMADWYSRADIYVMTSRWEGLPMVLLECMAHGTPAVVTDFDYGPRDIIQSNVNGLILPDQFDPQSLRTWANEVHRLLTDPTRLECMAKAALDVRDSFSESRILDAWEELLLGTKVGAAATTVAE